MLIIKDIVEPDFVSLSGEANALEAARRMKDARRGFVLVISSDGKPEGIVTEWDFLAKILSENKDPSKVKLSEIMSSDLVTVESKEGISSTAKLMADRGVRRVLVTHNGKVIGVVTAKTIIRRLEEYIDHISAQIARLSTPMF